MPIGTKETPSEKRATRHQDKVSAFFKGKKFKVLKEVHLTDGNTFKTPFGHRGKDGFILQEVDENGSAPVGTTPFVIGKHLLAKVEAQYGVVQRPSAADVVESTASTIAPAGPEFSSTV